MFIETIILKYDYVRKYIGHQLYTSLRRFK